MICIPKGYSMHKKHRAHQQTKKKEKRGNWKKPNSELITKGKRANKRRENH